MACLKPTPGRPPRIRSAGTRQSRKCSSTTGTQRMPILSSVRPMAKPGSPFSISTADRRRLIEVGSLTVKTV